MGEEWKQQALCRPDVYGGDPNVFYPPRRDTHERRRLIVTAKAICKRCPVIAECRDYADRRGETIGIWGGLAPEERGLKEPR